MTKTLFLILAVTCSLASVQAGPIGYAITSNGTVGTMDVATGSFQSLGCVPSGCATPGNGGGLGIGPGGALEVYDLTSQNLYRFNPATGASTLLGNTGLTFSVFAGLGDGRLFGVDFSSDLYEINATTGSATHIAHLLDASADGFIGTSLAGNGADLFFTYEAPPFAATPHDSTLYRVNPNTGMIQEVGLTGIDQLGGSAYINGILYGFTFSVSDDGAGGFVLGSGDTYRINTTTGAASLVGPYDAVGLPVYGATAAPEPRSWMLGGLGLLGLAGLKKVNR